jgi:predicted kinase
MSVVGGLHDFLEGDDVRAEIGEPTLQDLAAEVPGSAATPHVWVATLTRAGSGARTGRPGLLDRANVV